MNWLLLVLGICCLPGDAACRASFQDVGYLNRPAFGRTILHAPDLSSVVVSSNRVSGGDEEVVEPPDGPYTLATSQQLFKSALTAPDPVKRIRLPLNSILQLCEGQTIANGSHVIVDCQESTIDLRCSEWFHLDSAAIVQLFRCHVLWPPAQDVSNLQIGAQLLRVEADAALDMHGGSCTMWCQELLDMPGAASLARVSPGDVVPIRSWSTKFVYPPGSLELHYVTLYCTWKELAFDTSLQAFGDDLSRAAIANGANQTIQVTGLLTLEPPSAWNHKRAVLPGRTVIAGMSPFATIDFRGSHNIFELQAPAYGEYEGQRSLLLRDLTLANLPFMEPSNGVFSQESLSALLWIAVAGEGPSRKELPLYHLQNVHAAVSCPELAFLMDFFSRLQANAVHNINSRVDVEVLDARNGLMVRELFLLGMHSENYTITCEVLPRVPRQPALSADAFRIASAAALADSFIPPPAIPATSDGVLGEETALKIASICAGAC
eukprot:jgi/Ulvmu1/10596/UM065_0050.1